MINIIGNILIFTDIHFGRNNNALNKLHVCNDVIDAIINDIKKQNIADVLFLGDWFHERDRVDVNTLNSALKAIERLSKVCNLWLVVGNHDCYENDNTRVNSLNIFNAIKNVHVISDPTEVTINGELCLLAPWTTDFKKYKTGSFRAVLGHLDLPVHLLKDSYIQENLSNTKVSKIVEQEIDAILGDDIEYSDPKKTEQDEIDYTNEVIRVLDDNGIVMSGHIHSRSEKNILGHTILFVGSPWHQTFGENKCDDGYYILNKVFSYEFHHLDTIPKMKEVYVSDIIEVGVDKFDYSVISGNTIKLVYDIIVDDVTVSNITTRIENNNPFEISQPEYKAKPVNPVLSCGVIDDLRCGNLKFMEDYLNREDVVGKIVSKKLDAGYILEILKESYNRVKDV